MVWNMIGAAFAAAAPGIPSWSTGFQNGNDMGGLIAAVLAPAGGFGKFLLVLMAVSTSSTCAPTIYSFGECALQDWPLLSIFFVFYHFLFFFSIIVFDILCLCWASYLIFPFYIYSQLFYGYNPLFRKSASICLYCHVHSHVS